MHKLKYSGGYYSERTFHGIGCGMEGSFPSRKCYPGICPAKQENFENPRSGQLVSARPETYTAAGAFERRDSWLDACLGHRYVPFYVYSS